MAQYFKGDITELKFFNSAKPTLDLFSNQKSIFFDEAYAGFVLGELLYDNDRAPLSNAIPRTIFRETFQSVFDAFVSAGTFESYLSVFRKVFGDDVAVTFTVPAPGKLNIDIVASGVVESEFAERAIVSNAYVYSPVIDDVGDNIMFRTIKGFESQAELEQMLFELVPAGIYTEITLTL